MGGNTEFSFSGDIQYPHLPQPDPCSQLTGQSVLAEELEVGGCQLCNQQEQFIRSLEERITNAESAVCNLQAR